MTGDSVRAALSQLGDVLDHLRERLGDGPGPEVHHDRDAHALDIFQEVLSVPPLGLPPGELFGLAMDRVSRLLAADRALLFVLDDVTGRLVPRSGSRLPSRRPRDRRARSGRGAGRARLRREARADLRCGRRAVRSRSVRRAIPDAAGHRGAGADRGRGRRRALRGPPGSGRALHHDRRAPAPRDRRPRRLLARSPAVARAPGRSPRAPAGAARRSWTRTSPRGSRARSWPAPPTRPAGWRACAAPSRWPARRRGASACSRARACSPASGPSGSARTTTLLVEGFAADGPVAIRDLQARRPGRPGVVEPSSSSPACSRRKAFARPCWCRCARAAAWWGFSAWRTRSRGTSRRRKRSPR